MSELALNVDDLYSHIVNLLSEMFEIDAAEITRDAHLYDDLDIDSIDAVDLIVELKQMTGKKIQPEDFKSVRTVQDIVDSVAALLN